jgi:hypothetical protein
MRLAIATLILAACAGTAWAQELLDGKAARQALLGVDMRGVHESSGTPFRECITPRGVTAYWFGENFDEGRVRIDDAGLVCFSYRSTNYTSEACWTAYRIAGGNLRFESARGSGEAFVTKAAPRVRTCPGKDAPVS